MFKFFIVFLSLAFTSTLAQAQPFQGDCTKSLGLQVGDSYSWINEFSEKNLLEASDSLKLVNFEARPLGEDSFLLDVSDEAPLIEGCEVFDFYYSNREFRCDGKPVGKIERPYDELAQELVLKIELYESTYTCQKTSDDTDVIRFN